MKRKKRSKRRATTATETAEQSSARLERENAALAKRVDDLETEIAILTKAEAFLEGEQ